MGYCYKSIKHTADHEGPRDRSWFKMKVEATSYLKVLCLSAGTETGVGDYTGNSAGEIYFLLFAFSCKDRGTVAY